MHYTQHDYLLASMLIAGLCFPTLFSCKEEVKNEEVQAEDVQASQHRMENERRAEAYLEEARQKMASGEYDAARNIIKEMRDTCYLALQARENAILLLDSLELMNAQADHSKSDQQQRVEFYQKKLEFDLQAQKRHQLK